MSRQISCHVILVSMLVLLGACTPGTIRVDHDRQLVVKVEEKPEIDLASNFGQYEGRFVFAIKQKRKKTKRTPEFKALARAIEEEVNNTGFMATEGLKIGRKGDDVFLKIVNAKFTKGKDHGKITHGKRASVYQVYYTGSVDLEFTIEKKRGRALQKINETKRHISEELDYLIDANDNPPGETDLREQLARRIAKNYVDRLLPRRKSYSLSLLGGGSSIESGVDALVRGNRRGAEQLFRQALQTGSVNDKVAAYNNLAVLYAKQAEEASMNDRGNADDLVAQASNHIQQAFMLDPNHSGLNLNASVIQKWADARDWIRQRKKSN